MDAETISYTEPHTGAIPEIPPELAAASEAEAEVEVLDGAVEQPSWLEESVRDHLSLMGSGLHMIFGGESDTAYRMSEEDLRRIAPPLTRILNRHESLAQFGVISDPLLLAEGSVLYVGRSMLQVRAAKMEAQERFEAQREPLEGRIVTPDPDEQDQPVVHHAAPQSRADRIAEDTARLRAAGYREESS